ncbi:sigma factor-like helix-turn-helix DNA-binding protein [Alicyclobacillus contaminans]|nr:sigma factor-like helix-turn-helix DNA-binding protein [Alicyclobacillus contaminans]
MTPGHRAVVVLYYFQEFSIEEIADFLHVPQGNREFSIVQSTQAGRKSSG